MVQAEIVSAVAEENYVLQDFFATPDVPHPTILLVGKRFSGKSTTSVAIAKMYDAPRWAAWCGTKDTQDYWADKFGSPATVFGPDDKGKEALLRIIQYQERMVRLYKHHLKKPFPKELTIGMVFDDVTSKRQFRKGEILEDLFSNGLHYKSIIIISCQYIKQLPPAVRTNTDYLFMLHNAKKVVRLLWEEYVENPDEFGMFLALLRTVTSQVDNQGKDMYNSLVYNNCVKTNRLDEMFQVYRHVEGFKASDITLGDPEWRKYNQAHYKDEEFEADKRELRKKKRERRLAEYRAKQQARRAMAGQDVAVDLDYFSDDEEESESEDSENDGTEQYKIRGKSGVVRIKMHNTRRQAEQDTLPDGLELPQSMQHSHQPYQSHLNPSVPSHSCQDQSYSNPNQSYPNPSQRYPDQSYSNPNQSYPDQSYSNPNQSYPEPSQRYTDQSYSNLNQSCQPSQQYADNLANQEYGRSSLDEVERKFDWGAEPRTRGHSDWFAKEERGRSEKSESSHRSHRRSSRRSREEHDRQRSRHGNRHNSFIRKKDDWREPRRETASRWSQPESWKQGSRNSMPQAEPHYSHQSRYSHNYSSGNYPSRKTPFHQRPAPSPSLYDLL
jgi:hypothetical protein